MTALTRRHTLLASAAGLLAAVPRTGGAAASQNAASGIPARHAPSGLEGRFELLGDWTFGKRRPDATIRDMAGLSADFRFRYIYDHGRLDGLPTYWSRHRDYPQGDPRALHVFEDDALVLKARVPPGGGLRPGGVESGMLRALLPVTEGMVVEMRARLPHGLGTWPAFWLNPGVEGRDGHFSATPWPPEIDIFEFFDWQGRDRPRIMTAHVQTAGHPERYGDPHDIFSRFVHDGYDPEIDFSAGYHDFALDWQPGLPTWIVDGQRVKQTRYLWPAPPAHILVTNQIGMKLNGVNLAGMQVDEAAWEYRVAWIRVWRRL